MNERAETVVDANVNRLTRKSTANANGQPDHPRAVAKLPPGRTKRVIFSTMLLLLWVAWPLVFIGDVVRVTCGSLRECVSFVWWELKSTWPGHLRDLYSRTAWRAFWSGGMTMPGDLAAEEKQQREEYLVRVFHQTQKRPRRTDA